MADIAQFIEFLLEPFARVYVRLRHPDRPSGSHRDAGELRQVVLISAAVLLVSGLIVGLALLLVISGSLS
jgi:predicted RNA-binding Zn ribbon-like protein